MSIWTSINERQDKVDVAVNGLDDDIRVGAFDEDGGLKLRPHEVVGLVADLCMALSRVAERRPG